jgi:hypothetical protein
MQTLINYTARVLFRRERFGAVTFNCEQEELLVAFNNDGKKPEKYGVDFTFQWEQVISIYYWSNSNSGAGTAQVSNSELGF